MRTRTHTLSVVTALALALTACSDGADPKASGDSGPSDDGPGDDGSDGGVDPQAARSSVSGVVTFDSAVEVRGQAVRDDGTTEHIGMAEVEADGHYQLDLEAETDDVIIVAFDSEGEIVGATLFGTTGAEDEDATALPITGETTVEAMVWLQAMVELSEEHADGGAEDVDTISMAEIMARIDAEVAAAVTGTGESGEDGYESAIDALAEAMVALHATQAAWIGRAGDDTDFEARDEAMAEATAALAAELTAIFDGTSSGDAETATGLWTEAWAMLDVTSGSSGGDDEATDRAELELLSGLTVRALTSHALGDGAGREDDGHEDVIEAMALLSGQLEAQLMGTAMDEATDDDGAYGLFGLDVLSDLTVDLVADAEEADSIVELQAAFDAWAEALISDGSGTSGYDSSLDVLLGLVIDVDHDADMMADGYDAAAELEASLQLALAGMASTGGDADSDVISGLMVGLWADFESDVEASVEETADETGSTASDAELSATADLVIMASGAFRGVYEDTW
ncbi:MAG: hypothetical protein H6742_15055 [Alphaproteobacteria bacterium]|nr:hypothetical protein [Alphaproteobacteria bacterium]